MKVRLFNYTVMIGIKSIGFSKIDKGEVTLNELDKKLEREP